MPGTLGLIGSLVIADDADQHQVRQEKESALQCLQMCSEVPNYLEERQERTAAVDVYETSAAQAPHALSPSSKEITAAILHFCRRQVCVNEECKCIGDFATVICTFNTVSSPCAP